MRDILTVAPGNHAPIGGLKVTADNGWFAVRPSGTEDVYKIYAESFVSQAQLRLIQQQAQRAMAHVLSTELQKGLHDMNSIRQSIRVDAALWASSMFPEGILERWRVAEGAKVEAGDVLAELRIEGALHEIIAPTAGIVASCATANDIVEPGSPLCTLQAM